MILSLSRVLMSRPSALVRARVCVWPNTIGFSIKIEAIKLSCQLRAGYINDDRDDDDDDAEEKVKRER